MAQLPNFGCMTCANRHQQPNIRANFHNPGDKNEFCLLWSEP
jgi:hypothetical protein